MKQDANDQIPGVDLTFTNGSTGRIWGVAGIDDIRGATFEKAKRFLRKRARQEGAFEWTIVIELDHVTSSAITAFCNLLIELENIAAGDAIDVQRKLYSEPNAVKNSDGSTSSVRRSITIDWRVKPGNFGMRSTAVAAQRAVKRAAEKHGGQHLIINVSAEDPKSKMGSR